jgi:hypothetical protein
MDQTTEQIGLAVSERLQKQREVLAGAWASSGPVRHVVLDDLLPTDVAEGLAEHFPGPDQLAARRSLGVRKNAGGTLDRCHPLLRATLHAFHEPAVVALLGSITGLPRLEVDPRMSATGVSIMKLHDFHRPHLDSCLGDDPQLFRALNVFLYVTPGWEAGDGGALELWDRGVTAPRAVLPLFNRLVLMETHKDSWHSVGEVTGHRHRRCLATALFTRGPLPGTDFPPLATFTGRPGEPVVRLLLGVHGGMRNLAGQLFPHLATRWRRWAYPRT